MPRDSKINEHKASLCFHFILINIWCQFFTLLTGLVIGCRKKIQILRVFVGTKSRKNRTISWEFCGNFWGKLGLKAIGIKMVDFVVISGQISLEIDRFFLLIRPAFLMFF